LRKGSSLAARRAAGATREQFTPSGATQPQTALDLLSASVEGKRQIKKDVETPRRGQALRVLTFRAKKNPLEKTQEG